MAITIGTDGFCEAADVTRFTRQVYTADSQPITLADAEEAIMDGFAIVAARLVALGLGSGPYADAELLRLARPINARLAASQLLYGQGDTTRGSAYYNQAEQLMDSLAKADGLSFESAEEAEPQRAYGNFGAQQGNAGLGRANSDTPITVDDIYESVKRIIVRGARINVIYNDVAEQIAITADAFTPAQVYQQIREVLTEGRGVRLVPDDGSEEIVISSTIEPVEVVGNPEAAAEEILTTVQIGDTVYRFAAPAAGGLDADDVRGLIRGGVQDWAEAGDGSLIPLEKQAKELPAHLQQETLGLFSRAGMLLWEKIRSVPFAGAIGHVLTRIGRNDDDYEFRALPDAGLAEHEVDARVQHGTWSWAHAENTDQIPANKLRNAPGGDVDTIDEEARTAAAEARTVADRAEAKADAGELDSDTVIEVSPDFTAAERDARNINISISHPLNAYRRADTVSVSVQGGAPVLARYDPGLLRQVIHAEISETIFSNIRGLLSAGNFIGVVVTLQIGTGRFGAGDPRAGQVNPDAIIFIRTLEVPVKAAESAVEDATARAAAADAADAADAAQRTANTKLNQNEVDARADSRIGALVNDDRILDLAKAARGAADRGKVFGTATDNENNITLLDRVTLVEYADQAAAERARVGADVIQWWPSS